MIFTIENIPDEVEAESYFDWKKEEYHEE